MAKAEFSWPLLGVIIPCILIACCGYGTYFFILVPHHETTGQLIWFQFSLAMTWLSYYQAITTNPGKPSKSFEPQPGEWIRWCVKCDSYKPERTHHCKQCKQCVLKMDHHCPWTYNCVGHKNMPHFIRFLAWVLASSCYAFYHLVARAIDLYKSRHLPAYLVAKSEIWATVSLIPVVLFVVFTVSLLALRVSMNVINGQTQIESWEIERVESLVRHRLVRHVDFPYDLDPFTNIADAWGHPVTWFWPWGEAGGDGMHFEKNEAADDGSVWPPDYRPGDWERVRDRERARRVSTTVSGSSMADNARTAAADGPGSRGSAIRNRNSSSPDWRQGFNSQADFYRADQWENYEGEKLSDFGVDNDTIERYSLSYSGRGRSSSLHSNESTSSDDDRPLSEYIS